MPNAPKDSAGRRVFLRRLAAVAVAPLARPARASAPSTPSAPSVNLAAVGDLMLARSVGAALERDPADGPFAGVRSLLRAADITIGNLECALGRSGKPAAKAYTFRAPPAAAERLADAGFALLSLANNHSLDYGPAALGETISLLDGVGVRHVGAGPDEASAYRPALLDARGLRLAVLAYVNIPTERGGFRTESWRAVGARPGVAWAVPQRIAADVADARREADAVIMLLHSGYEGDERPNAVQRAAAYAAIDAGAALVIGAHPHVLQGLQRYRGGVIAYSLGNFVFDGLYSRSETAVLNVTLGKSGVQSIAWTPVALRAARPQVATGTQAATILQRIERLSRQLG